jgi:hypothetical protein
MRAMGGDAVPLELYKGYAIAKEVFLKETELKSAGETSSSTTWTSGLKPIGRQRGMALLTGPRPRFTS